MRLANTEEELRQHKVQKSNYDYRVSRCYKYRHTTFEMDRSLATFANGHSLFMTLIRCRFSPEYTGQRFIYTGSFNGPVCIYDTKSGSYDKVSNNLMQVGMNCCSNLSRDVSWYPNEPCLFSTSFKGLVNIYNFNANSE